MRYDRPIFRENETMVSHRWFNVLDGGDGVLIMGRIPHTSRENADHTARINFSPTLYRIKVTLRPRASPSTIRTDHLAASKNNP